MTIATSQQIAPEAATSPWTGFRSGLWQRRLTFVISSSRITNHTTEMTLFLRPRQNGPGRYGIG